VQPTVDSGQPGQGREVGIEVERVAGHLVLGQPMGQDEAPSGDRQVDDQAAGQHGDRAVRAVQRVVEQLGQAVVVERPAPERLHNGRPGRRQVDGTSGLVDHPAGDRSHRFGQRRCHRTRIVGRVAVAARRRAGTRPLTTAPRTAPTEPRVDP
jgi:hypothetical protein